MSDRNFSRVLAAEGRSNFGSMTRRLAIPRLAVLTLQATPSQLAALLVAAAASCGLLTVAFELARSAGMAQRTAETDLPQQNARLWPAPAW